MLSPSSSSVKKTRGGLAEISSWYFLLLDILHQSILAIYAPMIYTASCIMLLMRADPYSFDTDPDPVF